ncbi:hypothetical protein U9M48_039388, partial [Paspalum notatum var. saurae]
MEPMKVALPSPFDEPTRRSSLIIGQFGGIPPDVVFLTCNLQLICPILIFSPSSLYFSLDPQ